MPKGSEGRREWPRESGALRGVVFDLDGLIFNTEELYEQVGAELLRRRGHSFSRELLDAMMGRQSKVALQIMIDWFGLDATVAELEEETDAVFPRILDTQLRTMPGFLPLLETLERETIPRGVATSSRLSFVTNVLSRFHLQPRFQFVLTAEDVERGKPAPEIYQRACAQLQLPPEEVMVLEDSENGCRAAVAAGTFAVAVPGEHSRDHNFDRSRFVADSLADSRIFAALGLSAASSS